MGKPDPKTYLRTSLAAAMQIKLAPGRFLRNAAPPCVNLLQDLDGGCRASCGYCGLSRDRDREEGDTFIRVKWPRADEATLARLIEASRDRVRRVCIATIIHRQAVAELMRQLDWLSKIDIPLSALVSSLQVDRDSAREMRERGAQIIGLGMDAASAGVMEKTRSGALGRWETHWKALEAAVEVFGGANVNAHIVVGLGETDDELVDTAARLYDMGARCFLFSFCPEPGTRMAGHRKPPIERWRRLQFVTYLLENNIIEKRQVRFDEHGALRGLELEREEAEKIVRSGAAFQTDGCPDRAGKLACTRPFGSYRAGEPFRDYPFPPTEEDLADIREQLDLGTLLNR
ncbi:MAG: radical SAM protein [Pseudomonadota bacterium]